MRSPPPQAKPSEEHFSFIPAKGCASAPQVGQTSAFTSSTLPPTMVVTPTSQFNPTIGEMLHYVEDDSTSFFPVHEASNQLPQPFGEPIVPEIPVASGKRPGKFPRPVARKMVLPRPPKASKFTGIPILQPKKVIATASSFFRYLPSISTEVTASRGDGVMHPPFALILHLQDLP
ncbi:hypothetical protein C1H46_031165 [Malus baccata]|uniref:Uncharacterized protein n=1 Tax=Malus baccata TaxID=106549 RepID=A0A540LA08_MALBA|nr:hypothetical protein C1H46_031165 [Malus baccata]